MVKHATPSKRPIGQRKSHGLSKSREHAIWRNMLQRCLNPNCQDYSKYGGRGITVCERWREFACFFADMGARPDGTSLDRVNNDGNYEPSNCRWANSLCQNNNSRHNRMLELNGVSLNVSQWAHRLGVTKQLILGRLNLGWSVEDALTAPCKTKKLSLTLARQ